jgi:sterol desaturase/sphingolipid hydroxylase (fatty acid hydroxylase superfamily)
VVTLQHLVSMFLVIQSTFILLDFFEIWRQNGKKLPGEILKTDGVTILFLVAVWITYLLTQTLIMVAVPSPEASIAWFANLFRLETDSATECRAVTAPWTLGMLFVVGYFVAGFWDYVFHRWVLHKRKFWFLHENHHLPTQVYNGMPGISVRPFVAPTAFLTYFCSVGTLLCCIKWAQWPSLVRLYLAHLPTMILFFALVGSASHSCFLRRFRSAHFLLRTVFLTTPQEHILHHAARLQGNYGNFMTFWDRVFGTYLDPLKFAPDRLELGLTYDQDFRGTLTGGKWKLSQSSREKYRLASFCHFASPERPSEPSSSSFLRYGE